MSVPPELVQALQGGGPPSPRGGPAESITSNEDGSSNDMIRVAIRSLQHWLELNDNDADAAKVQKCIVGLQGVLADHQKDREAALGISPALRHVRRSSQTY